MLKIAKFITKNMAVIVLSFAAISLFYPSTFSWIKPSSISYLLGIVMLCMGMTLQFKDFRIVFSRPRDIIIGCIAQFTLMPIIAWGLVKIFDIPIEYAIGIILVGCCPGGTSSNVITYLAKGDLALSVAMTTISTILAPIITPLLCWFYVGELVDVDIIGMLISILSIVIIPIMLGLFIQKIFTNFTSKVIPVLPSLSSIAIVIIVGVVVSTNSNSLKETGLIILSVVILHNVIGYLLGLFICILLRMPLKKCIAISIEVGMQNSGLACSLAQQHFNNYLLATVPGAIFSVWHNISGAIIARIYSNMEQKSDTK